LGAEAETRILPLAFAPLKRLKPEFCGWQFKTVRTVDMKRVRENSGFQVGRGLSRHDLYYGEAIGAKFDLPKLFKHPLTNEYAEVTNEYAEMVFAIAEITIGYSEMAFAIAKLTNGYSEKVFAIAEITVGYSEMAFAIAEITNEFSEMAFAIAEITIGYSDVTMAIANVTNGLLTQSLEAIALKSA